MAGEFTILLAFSGVRAALLASTGFNDRVAECHSAAAALLEHLGRDTEPPLLHRISDSEFCQHKALLGDTAEGRRAEHFFSEAARVAAGCKCWSAGDLQGLGQLMNASGVSSVVNYEVRS